MHCLPSELEMRREFRANSHHYSNSKLGSTPIQLHNAGEQHMNMQGMADPDDRDLRRLQLTKRLVGHQARPQTIYRLTGYTRHRLATLRRRWRVSQGSRHRGPAPTSYSAFFHS